MSVRRGLGTDPLDSLTTDGPPVAPVVPVAQTRKAPPRRLRPIKLDGDLVDQAVRAVWFLMTHGQPTATLKNLAEEGLRREIRRLQDEHNDSQPFPDMGPLPAGGRPQPG
jgi:hypothetical protein